MWIYIFILSIANYSILIWIICFLTGVCYEPVCTGRTNGVYQDTTHACRRSFACHAGRIVAIDNCPPYHMHNGHQCVQQNNVMCEHPQTTAIAYPYTGDQRCARKEDGSYGIDDCSRYIICRNGEVIDIRSCFDGYKFKNEVKQCVLANQVPTCPSDNASKDYLCRHKNDGPSADPASKDCSEYIVCKDQKFVSQHECTDGSIFNGEICVPSQLYKCPVTMATIENDICKNQKNGFHINPPDGCSSYRRCTNGRTVDIFRCPNGQYFDPDEKNCVVEKFPERRKCLVMGKTPECVNATQGPHQDLTANSQCQKYYFCIYGYRVEYKCSPDKVFNGYRCVSKSSYSCPSQESNSCTSAPDGYYTNRQEGCRSYYYCSSGHKINYLCEEGYMFDGAKCTKASRGSQCSKDSICAGKPDGYYADLESNCRDYVYCVNNDKGNLLTCRNNNIFNGEKCVSPDTYTCPSNNNHKELNCVPKDCAGECVVDGFFPDIESGCKDYFFCIGGKKSMLSCSGGQVFNGEICVAEEKYLCPIYCDWCWS